MVGEVGFDYSPCRRNKSRGGKMVGASGFEPPASASRTLRANQAALRPADNYYKATAVFIARWHTERHSRFILSEVEGAGGKPGGVWWRVIEEKSNCAIA